MISAQEQKEQLRIAARAIPFCRYCGQLVAIGAPDFATTTAYWKISGLGDQPRYRCHVSCKRAGELGEALNCQTIDADCNDCAHFERQPGGDGMHGHCRKFDRPAIAHPGFASLLPCFEHRRAAVQA
jgi:hypothetical protein